MIFSRLLQNMRLTYPELQSSRAHASRRQELLKKLSLFSIWEGIRDVHAQIGFSILFMMVDVCFMVENFSNECYFMSRSHWCQWAFNHSFLNCSAGSDAKICLSIHYTIHLCSYGGLQKKWLRLSSDMNLFIAQHFHLIHLGVSISPHILME